jgi:tRNA threonylcarbamoyl adenosine modification protein (Sua5/YciO/YrdC/YwlC family)
MKTIISKINDRQLNSDIIKKAGNILREGGLVAFPTETVYGLGADALNENAAKKIYAAKGRPSDNPLIVHIADMEALEKIVRDIPDAARTVAERYWPGPLTMIFNKSSVVPYGTTGGLDTVAVRMPSHKVACALIEAGGGYIAAPSANTSGRPSPTKAEHVKEDMEGKIEMILDGGTVEIGLESTILDISVTPPMILRPGAVTKEMLEELLGEVTVDNALLDEEGGDPPKAPGMKYRHYAPKAKLCVVEGDEEAVVKEINRIADENIQKGNRVGIIGTQESIGAYLNGVVKCIGTRQDETTIANHLYAVLREFDEEDVDCILSEAFSGDGIGNAVMNRLLKAAGHHIIQV